MAACLGVSITGAVPKIAFGFGLCMVVDILSVLLGGPKIAVGFCLTVVEVIGTASLGLVCRDTLLVLRQEKTWIRNTTIISRKNVKPSLHL